MKILFTIILTCLLSLSMKADNYLSNGLNIKTQNATLQAEKYCKLMSLAKKQMKSNTQLSLGYVYEAHKIAIEINDAKKIAESDILTGDIFCLTHSYPTAITYYEKAIKELEKLEEHKIITKLYITIADLYRSSSFNPEWVFEAMKNAERHSSFSNDRYLEIYTLLQFGNTYLLQNNDSLANTYYDKVLDNKIETKTIRNIAEALTGKARIEIRRTHYENALNLIDSSSYLCIRDLHDSLLIKNYGYKAEIYDSVGNYEESRKYYLQGMRLAYANKDHESCGQYMLSFGMLNKKENNYDDAIKVFEILKDSSQTFGMYKLCYESYLNLSECYASQGKYEKAYHMLKQHNAYYDSANIHIHKKEMDELKTNYILSLKIEELNRKNLELKEIQHKRNNLIYIIITSICVSISLIILIILLSRSRYLKMRVKEYEYQQEMESSKTSNKMMEIQLKTNKEALMSFALHLKSFSEYINFIKDEIKNTINLPDNERDNKLKSIYQNMQNNFVIYKNMKTLHNQIDNIYKEFLDQLEQKYPTITKSEKRLCTMLYINMSSKEIATITNTTLRSVETSRYRLRKKLNLDKDEDIIKFLKQI